MWDTTRRQTNAFQQHHKDFASTREVRATMTQRLIFTSTPPVPTNSRPSLPLFCAQKRKTKSKPSSEQTDLQIEEEKRNFSVCIQISSCLNQRRSPEYIPLESFMYLMNSLHARVPLLTQSFSRRETMGHVRHNKHLTGMKFFLGSDGIGTTTSDDISLTHNNRFLFFFS